MRRRGLFAEGAGAGEIQTRPTDDARRRGRGRRPPNRVMQELPALGRAGSHRNGRPLRRRDHCARVARAACVLSVRRS